MHAFRLAHCYRAWCIPPRGRLTHNSMSWARDLGPPQQNWDNSSKIFGPNNSLATLNVTFTTGVSAVGFDAFPGPLPGNIAISLFDPSNDLLGRSIIPASVGANFFGVVSTTGLIGRVNIEGQTELAPFEAIDNLAFGTTSVPEPSLLLLFAVGLAIIVGLGVLRSCDIVVKGATQLRVRDSA